MHGIQTGPYSGATRSSGGTGRTEPVIEVNHLIKQYGRIEALRGVSLTVNRGEIFGLLGQNGAGKTTLVKILLGITKQSMGDAELLGMPAGSAAARKRIGYLPEDHHFPDYHTGYSLLDFYGSLVEMPLAGKAARIEKHLEMVGLKRRMHYKIRTYSKGMKQRVGIAQALVHDPEVIFLDEPTDGVDPLGRREIRDLLHHLKDQGKTIFINSHLLGEVELLCDRVAIMDKGALIRLGTMAELTKQRGLYVLGLAPGETFPHDELLKRGYQVAAAVEPDRWEIGLAEGQTIDAAVDAIQRQGLKLRHLTEKRQTLEDLFIKTVEAAEPGVDQRPRRNRYRD